jgi:hypothetical protein
MLTTEILKNAIFDTLIDSANKPLSSQEVYDRITAHDAIVPDEIKYKNIWTRGDYLMFLNAFDGMDTYHDNIVKIKNKKNIIQLVYNSNVSKALDFDSNCSHQLYKSQNNDFNDIFMLKLLHDTLEHTPLCDWLTLCDILHDHTNDHINNDYFPIILSIKMNDIELLKKLSKKIPTYMDLYRTSVIDKSFTLDTNTVEYIVIENIVKKYNSNISNLTKSYKDLENKYNNLLIMKKPTLYQNIKTQILSVLEKIFYIFIGMLLLYTLTNV